MKKIKILSLIILIITICLINQNNFFVRAYSISKSEICIDGRTGKILHSYNENIKLPMASTTKILTCITAIENADLNSIVTIKPHTIDVEGSSIYLKSGEKYTLKSLLYGLMLRSGNDSAETIADFVCGRDKFITLMNETSLKCGCLNSNYTNPHGLDNKNHYTTASDLAKITSYALKNEIFREIVSTKKIEITELSQNVNKIFYNKNKMLSLINGCIGVKTGYTKKSGRCLVSACIRGNLELVCVVLNSPQMFERSCEIIENCYKNYNYEKIFDKND